jgi:hypothetical protein
MILNRSYCNFDKPTNSNTRVTQLLKSRIANFPKTLLLVDWAKIQYARVKHLARFLNKPKQKHSREQEGTQRLHTSARYSEVKKAQTIEVINCY